MVERAGSLCYVSRIQFNTDIEATEPPGDETHGSRPEKGIEHEVAWLRRSENAGFNQGFGKRRDVGTPRVQGIDAPDGPSVSFTAILGALLHGLMVVGVLFALCEHEDIFVRASRPILHAFRHRVWLMPDNVATEEPAAVLKRECEAPRNAEQVLVLKTGRILRAHIHRAIWVFLVGGSPSPVTARVAISDVQPQDAIRFQDAPYLRENRGKRLNEPSQRRFETDLSFDSVVTQSPVWRRGHDALHRLARKTCEGEAHIALQHRRVGKVDQCWWD